jgi:hypothetical protein
VSELTVLLKRARTRVQKMFAHLSFVLLFQLIELTLIAVHVVKVLLLSHLSHNLLRWVVEVLFLLAVVTNRSTIL